MALPTKLKLFSYTLYSTRKLMCELEHHRSHKKEVHLFKKVGSLWVVALYSIKIHFLVNIAIKNYRLYSLMNLFEDMACHVAGII